jgi:hypothetical protein
MAAGLNEVDTSQFIFALRAYKAATKKDCVEVLNRAARNVAFRASSFTPKGAANKIRRDLMRDPRLRYALTSIALRKKGIGRLPSPQFQKAVDRLVSRRASSANYLRAGWAKAIQDLGGSFRGAKFRGAGGFGNKARVNRLLAEIVNTTTHEAAASVRGAELIGSEALQKAIAFVSEDMISYARQLMGPTAKKFSATR